jgi:hypothetical protein
LLIAAGGGGGAAVAGTGAPGILTGQNASTGTSGTAGQDGLNAGGTNGAGGSSSGTWSGAAGAGFSSNGGSAFQSGASISNSQGFSYASGFLGGVAAPSYGSPGGFGGGGGSSWGPSGGGGYSGGGSDNTAGSGNDRQGGGGGGSFNSGTSQSTSSGISGAGSVTITFAPPSPAFASGVQKAPSGTYTLRSANGWTNASAGMFTVNSYDDGLTSNFSGIIPAGTSWFWNNVAYTSQIIYANSYISWSGAQDLLFYAGDQYWGTNGPNGTGSSNAGLGYKSGVTAGGWNYFYMNLQGYQYGATGSDRTWEAHFVYNSDNSIQYIEIIVPATVNSPGSFTEGPTSPTNNRQNLFTLAGSTVPASGVWSSTNKGVTWTFLGSGSLTNIPS